MTDHVAAPPENTPAPVHTRPADRPIGWVRAADLPADTRRGGVIRTLLSPRTVGSRSGVLGVTELEPGQRIAEHYHPYSEEFLYVVRGEITADLDGELFWFGLCVVFFFLLVLRFFLCFFGF